MAPQRFKPNQEVVCVTNSWTPDVMGIDYVGAPKLNEICTIASNVSPGYVTLKGYPSTHEYGQQGFEPILPDEAITSLLEEALTPQTI